MPQPKQSARAAVGGPLRYQPSSYQGDEAYTEDGQIKPIWQGVLGSLEQLGVDGFRTKRSKSLRILRDDGATYKIYSDLNKSAATWSLDLVPNLIASEEWAEIEAGLLERAELYNLLLEDIYGPRRLISSGVIPAEALFAHPGFLRACDGLKLPGEQQLILHGVDIVRDGSGEFCVMTDRTQAPSGAGYALENRTVMSRVFPSLYRESQVHRLASFFQRLRSKLTSLSPNQEQARIVLLTPGAHNEAYFEHAYIANYLGLHLVQSGDLLVRNGHVWMKSLEGLNRVDVILRRVDDWYCDPVELRGDSLLGVAGLLEVVRAGKVVVANPLGSGVLENPVFLRYLPDIAKQLLGRQMSIKTVTTYWCGDADDLNYVRAHFEQLVIKPIFRGQSQHSQFVGALSQAQQRELLAKIEARPMYYVAQPIVALSKQPSYQDGSLQARPSILRSFISASEGSYIVMPGGLTRVGQQESARHISNQLGSYSKDTWVLASEPHVVEQTAAAATGLHQQADLISLPSRVVENLFWMGRYAERVEASLRLLRTIFIMFNGEELPSDNVRRLLLTALTRLTSTYPGFVDADAQLIAAPNDELLALVVDVNRLGSISANLNAMFYCADQSKEQMSSDALRVINDIRDMLVELQDTLSFDLLTAPEEALDPLVTALMAFSGLAHESMVRGVGWRFMEIGRRLERAMLSNKLIAELLTQRQSEADERLLASAALLCMENLISYRRRYSADINVESCLDLLMLARENPRALIFQLDHLYQYLAALPKAEQSSNELSVEESLAFKAQSQVKLSGLASLSQVQGDKRPELVRQMQELTELLEGISNAIGAKYFDHREVSHQLGQGSWGAQS